MTTKVVVYNEGPKNIAVDNGEEIKVVHPGARESQYVWKGKTLTVFEVESGENEAS